MVCDIAYYIAYDIAYDVSFVSNSGYRMACPDQRFICRFVFRLLYLWHPASALTATIFIATPCFPIQPRLASPPITGLPWNYFRGLPGCNPAPPPGAAAQHAEKCSMLCHCAATTAAVRTQQAADSVICARHEFVTLLMLELVHMQGWSS
jgi:hypothetical protein